MQLSPYEDLKVANEARVRAAEQNGDARVDAWPIDFVFEFTGACNLHCFMCGFEMLRDDLRSKGRHQFTIPVEQFREIAETVFPHIRTINPTVGGEPFVLPYWDEFVDTAAKYGCRLKLFTNGMLMRGDRLRKIVPQLSSLTISFDGATKETFEYVRTGAKFEQVMENLAEFSRLRREEGLTEDIFFTFNVTLLKENVGELAQIVEIAHEHGCDMVSAGFVVAASARVADSSPLLDVEATNAGLIAAYERAADLGMPVLFPEPLAVRGERPTGFRRPPAKEVSPEEGGQPKDWKGKYYCDSPWRKTFVGLGGELFPCCSSSRPIFGNAFEKDFFELWNSPEYQRLRTGLYTGDLTDYCKNCPFLQRGRQLEFDADTYRQEGLPS